MFRCHKRRTERFPDHCKAAGYGCADADRLVKKKNILFSRYADTYIEALKKYVSIG